MSKENPESPMIKGVLKNKKGCPPQKFIGIGVAGGVGWFVMIASFGIIILFAILSGLELLIVPTYWFWIMFGLIGVSLVTIIVCAIMGGNCVASMIEDEEI